MAFVYVVRCAFTDPTREEGWNAWYSGPKIAQMLRKPHFRTCQRFKRTAGRGRYYLALWTLQSPDAFRTEQYTSDWGFFDWGPYITDWSRDLFDGGDTPEASFAVPEHGGLTVVSFDGMSPDATAAARAVLSKSRPDMMWLPVIGLDRHTPLIGLKVEQTLSATEPANVSDGVQEALYRPISRFTTTDAGAIKP
jgi:hypothetical protein